MLSAELSANTLFISAILYEKSEFHMKQKQHLMLSSVNINRAFICLCFPLGAHTATTASLRYLASALLMPLSPLQTWHSSRALL